MHQHRWDRHCYGPPGLGNTAMWLRCWPQAPTPMPKTRRVSQPYSWQEQQVQNWHVWLIPFLCNGQEGLHILNV